jgi:hypothetical protein
VVAKVRCGGLHKIVLTREGRLILKEHDIESEKVIEALTGAKCKCREVMECWQKVMDLDQWERVGSHVTNRPAALPKALRDWAHEAWKRRQERDRRRPSRRRKRCPDLDQPEERNGHLRRLKSRLARRYDDDWITTRLREAIDMCDYSLPQCSKPSSRIVTTSYLSEWSRGGAGIRSVEAQLRDDPEYATFQQVLVSMRGNAAIVSCLFRTGGVARCEDGRYVCLVAFDRKTDWADRGVRLMPGEQIALAGWQNPETTVIRTRKAIVREVEPRRWVVTGWLVPNGTREVELTDSDGDVYERREIALYRRAACPDAKTA